MTYLTKKYLSSSECKINKNNVKQIFALAWRRKIIRLATKKTRVSNNYFKNILQNVLRFRKISTTF